MTMAKQSGTRVKTDKVRFLYTHLFEKFENQLSHKSAYSTIILIPKTDTGTVDAINAAIKAAIDEGKSRNVLKRTTNLRLPLRDGDEKDNELFHDCWYMNIASQYQPDIVDRRGNAITNPDEVYSGMYGRVSMNFYAYSAAGNAGISAGLGNVQKLADGERLGGRSSAKTDFEDSISDDDNNSDDGDSTLPF